MFNRFRQALYKYLGNSLPSAGLWSWVLPGEWSKADLISKYVGVVYSVISAIAEDAAKVEFQIKKGEKVLKKHPFYDFIKKPNPGNSQFQFLELHFTYMKLCGESYWYIIKGEKSTKPKEAYLLSPHLMQVVVKKTGNPRGLVTGYVMHKPDGKKIPFDKDEILHFKMPNPANPYYGMGTIQAAKLYIQTEESATEWTRNSLYNAGRPSGILNIKGVISDEQFKQIKRQFKEEYTGSKNAGKTMLSKGADGLDYQKLGMDLSEVAIKELKDMTRDDIMMMFRVSKTMIGISDDVNRANAQENHAVFTENVIKPEIDRLIDHLNAFFIPIYGEGTMLGYEDPDLQSDKDKIAEWTAGHNKWLTTNDIRAQRNLDPVEGGDVIYQPINLVPLTKESEKPREEGGGNEDDSEDNTDNQPDSDSQEDTGEGQEEEKSKKKLKKKSLTPADVYKEVTVRHQDQWINRYQEFISQEFELQLKEILKKNKKVAFPEWVFDVEASKSRIEGIFIPLGITLMQEAAKYAFELADQPDAELLINERIREYIEERVSRFALETNEATIEALQETITEGVRNGENLAKLRRRVEEVYDHATRIRAERIARTEALAASNEGALEAYRQSPVVSGKEWSANSEACQFCQALDGKIVELDEDYLKIGSTLTGVDGGSLRIDYENIGHPPAHPNCRCALLPVAIPL